MIWQLACQHIYANISYQTENVWYQAEVATKQAKNIDLMKIL